MKYTRVLLKLSGEFLGDAGGFSSGSAERAVNEICDARSCSQVAVLVGGGNIIRGRSAENLGVLAADYMGMTATLINAIGLKDAFERRGVEAEIASALELKGITEFINPARTVKQLQKGKVVIFAGGTGSPFFTTDTAAALRALEIKADAVLKATKVDGVYDKDPEKYADARLLEKELTIDEAISRNLGIMDTAAFSILKGRGVEIIVFNFRKEGALKKLLGGERVGTVLR